MFLVKYNTKTYSIVWLTALVPILLVYIPKPPISGSHFIVYPALAAILSVIIILVGFKKKIPIAYPVKRLAFLLLLYNGLLGISFLVNSNELRATAPLELFRPILISIFLIYGYYIGFCGSKNNLLKGLHIAAYIILFGQLVIAMIQGLGLNYFSILYSSEKSREFGDLFRVTGSLGNPNNFAWVVSNSAMIISVLADRKKRHYLPSLIIASILIIMSGSRTLLLLFPCMIISVFFFQRKRRKGFSNFNHIVIIFFLLSMFLYVVFEASQYFPYLSQLKTVFESGNFMAINSFAARVTHWQNVYQEFSSSSLLKSFLGLGSREIVSSVDNDWLYVLYRVGWLGLLIHLSISVYSFLILQKSKIDKIATIGMQYLSFALVLGIVAETLASWYQPLLLFFILGVNIGFSAKYRRQASFNDKFNII